ncbi:MAG: nascent polypeptide-associated complex protein [Nanoarchaeota archaeon]
MFPGVNPRQMKQMMKQMGIQQQEIEAIEVIIRCADKEIVITNPQVSKVNMMGQKTWQVVGEEQERSLNTKPDINEEDVKTVMEQSGCTEEKAKVAIEEANGDLATAILHLKP